MSVIYYKSLPKTISAAKKRGWRTLRIKRREDLTYFGIRNCVSRITQGRWVDEYDTVGGGEFAFEDDRDLVIVKLKFG